MTASPLPGTRTARGRRREPTAADAVVIGGGASGHLLLQALARSSWGRGRRVVLVDPRGGDVNGRCWAFWSPGPEPEARRCWDTLEVHARSTTRLLRPAGSRYWQVAGEDLLAATRAAVEGTAFEIVTGRAEAVHDVGGARCPGGAVVDTDAGPIACDWVFDSVLRRPPDPLLCLHFAGAVVRTMKPLPHPDTATLIDDRVADHDGFGFGYLLPLGDRDAFVEVTRFTTGRVEHLTEDLDAFARFRLPGCTPTGGAEQGRLDLTLPPRHRRLAPRVVAIGAAAGLVRASTGYGYTRMRADAFSIAASMDRHGHPFALSHPPRRHAWMDAVLAGLITRDPAAGMAAFAALFARVDIDRVLAFLDGATTLGQDARMARALPLRPFLRAAAHTPVRTHAPDAA